MVFSSDFLDLLSEYSKNDKPPSPERGGRENDGIGNACQCGDVTGNGVVNGQDASAIQRHALGQPSPLFGQHCQNADPNAPPCTNCQP